MKRLSLIVMTTIIFMASPLWAAFNTYEFEDPEKKERFGKLINELRCTVCQNQTIADSNADLAKDLRDKVYVMVQEGQNEEQIKTFLVDRFSDFVLYRPPVNRSTYLLWIGPFVLLIIAFIFLLVQIRKRNQTVSTVIDPQQHARIETLLSQQAKDNKDD
jgi:cytochrome c-type biogenesis protein CcmH